MPNKSKKSNYLDNLNQEQIEAVTFGSGPLLIVAGAGTGKTAVITRRIAYLIEKGLAEPEEILAVTFTEKAAQEMEERVDKLLPFGYLDLWVSTFHAFAQRVLEENGLDIGLPNNFKILDSTAAWLLIRRNLKEFDLDYYKPMGNPTKFIRALLEHFSKCKDQGIYPEDYLNYSKKLKTKAGKDKELKEEAKRIEEVARTYDIYQKLMLQNSFLDFGDLIIYCLKLFKDRPAILKKFQQQFKYILVDEFQDTNWAQYELVKLMAHPQNNITVCADDDQAIYRWRGASFNNVLKFKEDFENTKEVVLTKNYRSGQNILDLSYNFIQLNNPNRLEFQLNKEKEILKEAEKKGLKLKTFQTISKKLTAIIEPPAIIENLHFQTIEDETRGVVDKIEELMKKKIANSLSDFAILIRSNDAANSFVKELERKGISHQFLASRGLYSQPIIMDIIAYFKLLDNYHESPAVFRVLESPILDIPYQELVKITNFCRIKAWSIYETLQNLHLAGQFSNQTRERIGNFLAMIAEHTEACKKENVSSIFLRFLNDSKYLFYLVKNNKQKEISLLNQFYKKIKQFEETELEPRLNNFVGLLNMELESGELGDLETNLEEGPDMVKIITVHGAKGLEFPYVFLVNLVDRRFPTDQRKDPIEMPDDLVKDILPSGDVHLQEERRLFYVAMTRAKKGLFFCWSDDYGGQRKKKPSIFLYELGMAKDKTMPLQQILFEPAKEYIPLETSGIILPPYFSYTQISTFEKCPLQYKFAHILNIPRAGNANFSFGITIHRTLQHFCHLIVERGIKKISKGELLKIYEKDWIDDWYPSKEVKKKRFIQGKQSLENFYDSFVRNNPSILNINNQPALEVSFLIKIGDYTIKGQIDRIDKINDSQVEIIDYKTGEAKEKLGPEEKEQLMIYNLAAKEILKIKPRNLTYYYFDAGKMMSFLPTEKEEEEFKEKLLEKIGNLKHSDFKATPGWPCQFCDFKDICEFKKLT